MTFIIRVSRDEVGRLAGVVERVRTGQKERFQGVEALVGLIARLVESASESEREANAWPSSGSPQRRG